MSERMERLHPLDILVIHNADYRRSASDVHDFASRADVANAAAQIAGALSSLGHRPRTLGVDAEDLLTAVQGIAASPPDLVFNLCESLAGVAMHEPVLPALLDLLGVPYTGSPPLSLALALRKDRAKEILRARGVPTPWARTVTSVDGMEEIDRFPVIVKPTREDASVGIHSDSVARDLASLRRAVGRVLDELDQPALIEDYIEGREMYVSMIGNAPPLALPFHEIDFTDLPAGLPRIVSYAAKWDLDSAEFTGTRPVRCLLDEETRARVETVARAAFAALEMRDYARVDVRLSSDGIPYVIDINPNCDLSDGAGFCRAASFAGIDYPSLIERVCMATLERTRHDPAHHQAHRPPTDAR